jgi:hypothetical protein
MNRGGKIWLIIAIVVIIIAAAVVIFVLGIMRAKNGKSTSPKATSSTTTYPASASDQSGFELKKSSPYYTVYYHTGDDLNADKTLTVIDEAVTTLYQEYLGITPQNTQIYLAQTVEEYVKVADFPGGAANVQVGDGSAPNGKLYLYKLFENPQKGAGVIVHEGTHTALWGFFGGGQGMEKLPGFLNEGLAYMAEYVHKAGADFDPLKEIYFADLLKQAAKTGNPALMSLEDLGKNCEGYISDETRNGLCRGQGTFTVWYLAENYGENFWSKFLADLKTSGDWQKSLEKMTTKDMSQIGQEIDNALKDMVKQ